MSATTQTADHAAIEGQQQSTPPSGSHAWIDNLLISVAESLCEAVDLRAGQRVLDVATGSGNTALAAARRFGETIGIDDSSALLDRARARAAAEGLAVTFREGDVENLPFSTASFDVILSSVSVMFAPHQEQVARELLRVCRPGGKIGLAIWTPDGYVGDLFHTINQHVPPPPSNQPPAFWGTEARLRELFGDGIASLQTSRRRFVFRFPSAHRYGDLMRTHDGLTAMAFAALDPARQAALARDIEQLVERYNRADDGTMVVPGDYLEAVAIRR
jgi:SAM-dependent methyltransferase